MDNKQIAKIILGDIDSSTAREMKGTLENYDKLVQEKEKEIKSILEEHFTTDDDLLENVVEKIRKLFLV